MKKIGIVLFVAALFVSCNNFGEKKVFDGTEIYYKDGVSAEQVDKLGESLMESGFANGDRKSVQFVKDGDAYVFKMVVKEEFLDNESYKNLFKYLPKEHLFQEEEVGEKECSIISSFKIF